MNKTDLRVQKTYQALVDALLRLEKDQDINDISINDLCQESKIGRATFYRHFKNKDDFFQFAAERWAKKFLAEAFDNLDNFLEQRRELLNRIITAMFEFLDEYKNSLQVFSNFNLSNVFFRTFQEHIKEIIDQYCLRHGVKLSGDSGLLSSEIAGGVVYAGNWYQNNPDADLDETIEAVVDPIETILNIYFPAE